MLKISTIDSGMWNLTSGFGESAAKETNPFLDTILISKSHQNSGTQGRGGVGFFHEMEHIIIDEAQDVEEARSDLMEKF